MSSAAKSSYDAVRYQSNPFPQSQPDRLAVVARLFGLQPALPSHANVLELGCASGGNLIPLAARYPDATFLGIDFLTVQVSAARRQIAAIGLTNIRIEQGDITNFSVAEKFDYIICHGVYSWVPEATRAAILRLCRDGLSDHGVAYISYNTYPGWRLRQVVREAMLFHAGAHADNPFQGALRAITDGKRSVAEIEQRLTQHCVAGEIGLQRDGVALNDVASLAAFMPGLVEENLRLLESAALLK